MAKRKKYNGIFTVKGKNGISYGIDYVHPQTGQRIRKILKGCTNEADAFEKRSIELADAARGAINKAYGIRSRGAAILFNDMVDLYLKNWSADNKDSRTDRFRSVRLKDFFKGRLMSDITPFLVEKFKRQMAKDRSKNTVDKWLSLGSQVFEKARAWKKYNGENPFLKVDRFRVKKGKKPGSLSPGQVHAIMEQIPHSVKRDMVEFCYNTGWRISEITGLQWDDVKPEEGKAWIVDPKNGNTVDIELSDRAIELILKQDRNCPFVFSHKNGKPYKTGIPAVFKNAAEKAGIALPPRKAWHILRRTWASMFLQNGGDVETLRVLGNWKDYSMPMWYADSADSDRKREILNRIPKPDGRKKTEMANGVLLSA
ncbi:site-specific integrase [uncultured Desulfosarcina sp.]|uniref:tyrosine-type recombinase/integrase n=1 Tax=uncultured Desulfosarcina sp. TaxID=218289 RepID=UPI0029C88640|nr:site-specific integrase [uncultured Desulfosarcina sp.]